MRKKGYYKGGFKLGVGVAWGKVASVVYLTVDVVQATEYDLNKTKAKATKSAEKRSDLQEWNEGR